jgi:hypothetical protein
VFLLGDLQEVRRFKQEVRSFEQEVRSLEQEVRRSGVLLV